MTFLPPRTFGRTCNHASLLLELLILLGYSKLMWKLMRKQQQREEAGRSAAVQNSQENVNVKYFMVQHQYMSTINNPAFLSLAGSVDSMCFGCIFSIVDYIKGYVENTVFCCIPTVFLNTQYIIQQMNYNVKIYTSVLSRQGNMPPAAYCKENRQVFGRQSRLQYYKKYSRLKSTAL